MKFINEVFRNSGLGKWFHDESAGGKPGWDRYNSKGERVGECGDAEEGEPYSACLSRQKAKELGKEKIGNFVKRKRAAQSKAGRGKKGSGRKGKKPINVDTGIREQYDVDKKGPSTTPGQKMNIDKRNKRFKTPPCMIDNKQVEQPEYMNKIMNKSVSQILGEAKEVNEMMELLEKNSPTNKKLWSKAKSLARQKFDVYPSAYANAWAAKWYKKKGGGWRKLNENEMPYDNLGQDVDSSPEQAEDMNYAIKNPEKLADDLPVEKVLKGGKVNPKKLRLEYFRNLLNNAKELNEEI
jgi:hypothetical protein